MFQLPNTGEVLDPLPINLLDDNPFNSRSNYDEKEIRILADSIATNGLLCPIQVRKKNDRYHLVYGHRRVRAARLLHWTTIMGVVGDFSDEQMLQFSLVENVHRHNLTDYETAASFRRLNLEFGKTYDEIGKLFGFSKSHVCNIIAMLNLFDDAAVDENPRLKSNLLKISEHHSRILSRISDMQMRTRMLELTVSQGLSVRELQKIVGTLRGWFSETTPEEPNQTTIDADLERISDLLAAPFVLPQKGEFQKYLAMHAFDKLSVYDDFAPYERLEDEHLLVDHMKVWFNAIAPQISMRVRDLQVKRFGDVALATAYVDYKGKTKGRPFYMVSRGTVVFSKSPDGWKIVHKHWSKLEQNAPIDLLAKAVLDRPSLPGQTRKEHRDYPTRRISVRKAPVQI